MALTRSWRNDFKVWGTCRQYDLISDAEQFAWFERIKADPTIKMYKIMVENGEKTAPVGVCGFTSIDKHNRRAEFSCYIAPVMQGRGLSLPALEVLFKHGFENHGFHLIWGECFDGNHAMKVFTKLGMRHEGTRKDFYFREGRFIDAHLISITGEEFYACLASRLAAHRGGQPGGVPSGSPGGVVEPEASSGGSAPVDLQPAAGEAEAGGQV